MPTPSPQETCRPFGSLFKGLLPLTMLGAMLAIPACGKPPVEADLADAPKKSAILESAGMDRKAARFRSRRLLFNNDGNDIIVDNTGPVRRPQMVITEPDVLLARRMTPLKGSQVESVSYCTTVGTFGAFTHKTAVGETFTKQEQGYRFNPLSEMIKRGTDPLRIVTGYCRENGLEVFWSLRMNDTHDASKLYRSLFFSQFKKDHPEVLFGTPENPPKFGLWSAVDFGAAPVREFVENVIAEVLENYEVDGVELDFWRHPIFFKRSGEGLPLRQEELDAMSDLIHRIRQRLDEAGARRGKALLLAIKVPDSVDYCRAIGLDIEHWMSRGWVDLLIPGGYFQLTHWTESVALGKRYGVPVYACLPESRIREDQGQKERSTLNALRARALAAWEAGVHGIAMFNRFDVTSPLWRELGSPEQLRKLPKTYFLNAQGVPRFNGDFQPYVLSDGYRKLPDLSPNHPEILATGESQTYEIYIGDDLRNELTLEATLHLRLKTGADKLEAKWDGASLPLVPASSSSAHAKVDSQRVTPGLHRITLSHASSPAGSTVEIRDVSLEITKSDH